MRKGFWFIMAVSFLIMAGAMAVSVSEGWIEIQGLQDVAKWTCLTVVAVGCSLISLTLLLEERRRA